MAQTNIRPGDTPQKPTDPKTKPTDKATNHLPAAVATNAAKYGYNVVQRPDGSFVIKDPRVGYHKMTPDEIKFLQHAANKYDIATPGIADFNNAAYINGNFYHLSTGQGEYNGNQALTDEQLAAARARAGWTPETGLAKATADWQQMQKELGNPGSGELPAYLASPEGYQSLLDQQRANVVGQANPTTTDTTGGTAFQPFTDISGTQEGVPGYPVTQYQTAAEGLQAAHAALASHYASAATAGDFATATALQSTLAQHQALMPQGQAYTPPDTFSEHDLYLAQNQ